MKQKRTERWTLTRKMSSTLFADGRATSQSGGGEAGTDQNRTLCVILFVLRNVPLLFNIKSPSSVIFHPMRTR